MKVVQFQRKPYSGSFSIEGLFRTLRHEMIAKGAEIELAVLPWYSKGFIRRALSVVWCRSHQGDVNHITGDVHFIAFGMSPAKTILTIHDLEMFNRITGWRRFILQWFWFEIPVRRCAAVTVISEATKNRLLEILKSPPPERLVVIPDAIDPRFQPCPKPFPASNPTILQIGTKPNKNLPNLIAALTGMDVHLHIVGVLDEPQKNLLEESKIPYTNSWDLTDQQLQEAYLKCDLVSFVSLQEGFGMPIIEAQCVERPVITSNCSSMPEVAGEGACLVDPGNPESIRSGFLRIINDPTYREQLIVKGRENRSRFTPSTIAEAYLALYREIVNGNPL